MGRRQEARLRHARPREGLAKCTTAEGNAMVDIIGTSMDQYALPGGRSGLAHTRRLRSRGTGVRNIWGF